MSVYALHDRHIEQRDVHEDKQMYSSATNFTWMFTPSFIKLSSVNR